MKKTIILIVMFVLMISTASALKECKELMPSSDVPCMIITSWSYTNNCTTYEMKIYNSTPSLLDNRSMEDYHGTGRCNTTFNYSTGGSYIFNISSGGDSGRIIVEDEDEMAGLAIVVFILAIVGTLFYLPFKINFHSNIILNDVIKRSCWIIALFLMSLGSTMLLNMSDIAGFGLFDEIFRFTWFLNWAAYLMMVLLVLGFFFKAIKLWKVTEKNKRMGINNE